MPMRVLTGLESIVRIYQQGDKLKIEFANLDGKVLAKWPISTEWHHYVPDQGAQVDITGIAFDSGAKDLMSDINLTILALKIEG